MTFDLPEKSGQRPYNGIIVWNEGETGNEASMGCIETHNLQFTRLTFCILIILVTHVHVSSSQPLKDNLDSATYEVFEKDPVKYISYERVRPAIHVYPLTLYLYNVMYM